MPKSTDIPSFALAAFFLLTASVPAQVGIIESQQVKSAPPPPGWLEGDTATGDWGGFRTALEDHGVTCFGGYTAEVWGNTTGGIKAGADYTGLLDFGVDLDFEKLAGWPGASFHSSWLWLSGRNASEDLVGNILTISNIAGFSTLRAFELWFEQSLLDDTISIRAGQLAADQEFVISDVAALFINATFGWPDFISESLPNGGPAFPLATLGVRLAIHPVEWFSLLSGLYQGNPFEENVNRHGFRWRLSEENGLTSINEAQFRWNRADDSAGLRGTAKAGAWCNSEFFPNPANDEVERWGDYGFYGIIDQMLVREPPAIAAAPPSGKDAKTSKNPAPAGEPSGQGLSWFGRAGFQPQDRNFLGFTFDTGLAWLGPLPTRDADTIGVAFALAQLTDGAAQTLFDAGSRKAGHEMVLEATYDAEITPWLHVQPDLQYIMRPGATGDLGNALVIGARVSVVF